MQYDQAEGPLGIASRDGPFPLQAQVVDEYQRKHKFKAIVDAFTKRHYFYTEPREPFPATIHEQRSCSGGQCCRELFDAKLRTLPTVQTMLDKIRCALQQHDREPPAGKTVDSFPLVRLSHQGLRPFYVLVPWSQNLRDGIFQAVCMEMVATTHLAADFLGEFPPVLLHFAKGRVVGGIQWPLLEDELSLVKRLHRITRHWELSLMVNSTATLSTRVMVGAVEVPYNKVIAKAKADKAAKKAQAVLNKLRGLANTGNRAGKRAGGGQGKCGDKKGGKGKAPAPQCETPDSSTESSSTEDSADEYWRDILMSLEKKATAPRPTTNTGSAPGTTMAASSSTGAAPGPAPASLEASSSTGPAPGLAAASPEASSSTVPAPGPVSTEASSSMGPAPSPAVPPPPAAPVPPPPRAAAVRLPRQLREACAFLFLLNILRAGFSGRAEAGQRSGGLFF